MDTNVVLKKGFIVLNVLVLITFIAKGQSAYKGVSIASPNAASLGKFTDFPVSNHTGIPQINIPIYTVSEGSLELPVSLSYHAGGIKVMEPASSVGAGWALNAGGMITRTVRGAADEKLTTNCNHGHFSDYGYGNYFTTGAGSVPTTSGLVPADHWFNIGERDGEPDLFTFNFNGYSGKFYFRDDRAPILIEGQDLKIEYYFPADNASSVTPQTANIQGFIITTANGDKYYFGINEGDVTTGAAPVEMTFCYSATHQSITDRVISSWYLSKIVSADNHFYIKLDYETELYSYYSTLMFPIPGDASDPGNMGSSPFEYALGKNYIEGVRLSKIEASNCIVDFTPGTSLRTDLGGTGQWGFTDYPNTQAKPLGSISISNGQGDFCKKFLLTHSYFTDNVNTQLPGDLVNYNISTDKYRLKLDAVTEQSCDGSIVNPATTFVYYSNFLPRRLSFAQDHWGFYNGVNANQSLIPTYSKNTYQFIAGADRDSKWPAMQNGALTKITYPTGGSTTFEFEANSTWVNTTIYNRVEQQGIYYAGYTNTTESVDYNNIPFSANHYELKLTNNACLNSSSPSSCMASASLQTNTGGSLSIPGASANGGETTITMIVPPAAGNYRIHMFRQYQGQSGNGASLKLFEIVPTDVQSNVIVGGLRIKTITHDDGGASPVMVTSYSYNDENGKSSGILYSRQRYVQTLRNDLIAQYGWADIAPNQPGFTNLHENGCVSLVGFTFMKSGCPIIPMSTSQGNHIGYNEVKVSKTNNGYSIYRYYGSNLWDLNNDDVCYRNVQTSVCDLNVPSMPAPPLPYEFQRGELKYEAHFDQAGHLQKNAMYFYEFDSSNITTPAYKVETVLGYLLGVFYDLKEYRKKKTEVTETVIDTYGTSLQTKTTTYFESPYHFSPTKTVTLNSIGKEIKILTKYANDFRVPACDAVSSCVASYQSACSSCDATYFSQIGNCPGLNCIFWKHIDRVICYANARKSFSDCRRTNFTNPVNAFKTAHDYAKQNADDEFRPILHLQDKFINSAIETTIWKDGKLVSAKYNKYALFNTSGNEPYVYPSIQQQLKTNSLLTNFAPSLVSGNTLIKDSRYTNESTIQFFAGNLVQVLSKDGMLTSYIWGYNNNLPIVKAINIDFATLKAAYDQVNGDLVMLRSQTTLEKAHITTYAYVPLQGMVSETNPTGRTTYYDYDKLGRLLYIKDNEKNILKKYEYQYHQ